MSCERHQLELSYPAINPLVAVGSFQSSALQTRYPLIYFSDTNGWQTITNTTASATDGNEQLEQSSSDVTSANLTAVSCNFSNSPADCVAIGQATTSRGTLPYAETSSDSGQTWAASATQPELPDNSTLEQFNGLACTSNYCVSVGSYVPDLNSQPISYNSTDYGNTWGTPSTTFTLNGDFNLSPANIQLFSVACANTNCVAVGLINTIPISYTSTDSGSTWSTPASFFSEPTNFQYGSLSAIACDTTNAQTCFAVGSYYSTSTQPLVYSTTNGGSSWTLNSLPLPTGASGGALTSISCNSDASGCVAAGQYDGTSTYPVVYTYSNGTWSLAINQPETSTAAYLTGVACDSTDATTCTVVGATQSNLSNPIYPLTFTTSDINSVIWSNTSPATSSDSISLLTGISCNSTASSCIIIGDFVSSSETTGIVYSSSDSGTTTEETILSVSSTAGVLQGIVCNPSLNINAVLCVAAGYSSATNGGTQLPLIITSANAGATWATGMNLSLPADAQSALLSAIHCVPLTNTCFAVGSYANSSAINVPLIYQSTNGGSSWSAQPLLPTVGTGSAQLNAIRCNATGDKCYTVGYFSAVTQQPLVYYSQNGGTTWALASISSNANATVLTSLTCEPTGVTCIASGYTDSDERRPVRYLSSDSGLTWTTLPSLPELSSWLANRINGSN